MLIGGCRRPVFPDDSSVQLSVTGLDGITDSRYIVTTSCLVLLRRGGAPGEQGAPPG